MVGIAHGHTSALFQDSNGIWYYYYWGNKEAFVQEITDSYAMDSLESLNTWLQNNTKYDGNAVYSGSYDKSTYIAGDFTKSLEQAINLSKNYKPEQYSWNTRNCLDTSWECLIQGKFNDGTKIKDVVDNDIGMRPNSCYGKFVDIFYNSNFTHKAYWQTINDKLWQARQDRDRAWTYWGKKRHQKNVTMLERLYY